MIELRAGEFLNPLTTRLPVSSPMRKLLLVPIVAVVLSLFGGLGYDTPAPLKICDTYERASLTFDEIEHRNLWIHAWAEWLAQECPPAQEVHLTIEWLGFRPGLMGYTARRADGDFQIVLGSHLTATEAWDTIGHEWAHALAYPDAVGTLSDAVEIGGHTAYWGVAYSVTYNAIQRMPYPDSVKEWREAKRAEEKAAKLADLECSDLPIWRLAPGGTTGGKTPKGSEATLEKMHP